MDYSAKIYGIYLRYVSKEDIHVYSVDAVSYTHLNEDEMGGLCKEFERMRGQLAENNQQSVSYTHLSGTASHG